MQALVLTLMIPAITFIFAGVFAVLWYQDRTRKHVLAYAYCYAALASGVVINIWIFDNVGPLGIVSYHLLSMTGLLALLWGTAHRVGLRIPVITYSATIVVTCGILWVASVAGETDAMRMAQHLNSSLLLALAAQNLWHAGRKEFADRALIWVFVAFAAFGFCRPLLTVFSDQLFGAGEEGAALLFAVHVLALAILLTLKALCLIAAILNDKQNKQTEESTIDILTGLRMRASFEEQATAMLVRASEERVNVSLLVGDIDHFKRVNDTWGHSAGDRVIAAFGNLIGDKIRPGDLAGRIGGEEFCMLVWNCPESGAVSLGNRLRQGFAGQAIEGLPEHERFTASFGAAQWEHGESYSDIFKRADAALYKAKRAGRNRVRTATDGYSADDDSKRSITEERGGSMVENVVPLKTGSVR